MASKNSQASNTNTNAKKCVRQFVEMVDNVRRVIEEKYDENIEALDVANEQMEKYRKRKDEFASEFMQPYLETRKCVEEVKGTMEVALGKFRKDVENIENRYEVVRKTLKDGQQMAKRNDKIVDMLEGNMKEFEEIKRMMEAVKSMVVPNFEPITYPRHSDTKSSESTSSTISQCSAKEFVKPIETELASTMARIIDELSQLRYTLHTRKLISNFIDDIIRKTDRVGKILMDETRPQTMEEYLRTVHLSGSEGSQE